MFEIKLACINFQELIICFLSCIFSSSRSRLYFFDNIIKVCLDLALQFSTI